MFYKFFSGRLCYSELMQYLKTGFRRTRGQFVPHFLKACGHCWIKAVIDGMPEICVCSQLAVYVQVNPPGSSSTILHVTSSSCISHFKLWATLLFTGAGSPDLVFLMGHCLTQSSFCRSAVLLSKIKWPGDHPGGSHLSVLKGHID